MTLVFKWEIGNMNYFLRTSPIASPPFYIESSRTFKFCLKLYPLGHGSLNEMILVLWRCDNNPRSIELLYELQFDPIPGRDGENPLRIEGHRYIFQTPMVFPERRVYLTKAICECGPTLKITCKILDHENIFKDVDEQDMKDLSSQYATLLQEGKFSDLRIGSSDANKYFRVHKAILKARCGVLAKELMTGKCVDPNILQSILQFLYSGKLTTLTANITPVLMRSGSPLLKTMSPFIISSFSARTLIDAKGYCFDWVIENFADVKSEDIFSYVIEEGGTVIQLSLYPNRKQHDNISIDIFKSGGCLVKGTVYINITGTFIALSDIANSESNISLLEVYNTSSIREIFDRNPQCAMNGAINLKIYIYMCKRIVKYTTNVDEISYRNVSTDIMHLYHLREDFEKLFNNPHYSDVTLKVDNDSFHVHKAIISARSEVFSKMFAHDTIENRNNEVILKDIKPHVLRAMLLYMYSGQLKDLHLEFAIDLYYAADRYLIRVLKQKCSKFLESVIDADNVKTIQDHARTRSDDSLLNACRRFGKKQSMKSKI